MKNPFTKKETAILAILAALGLASYLSGLDNVVADNLGVRTPTGISLFFSTTYYVAFLLGGVVLATLKDRRAGAALVTSIILVFIIQAAFTQFAPRTRPPQAQHIGDSLMHWIQESGTTSSFPSGHSGSSVAVYATLTFLGINPLSALLLMLPIPISRLLLVQHYLSDVLGGAAIGYVLAKVSFMFLKKH